MRLGNMIYHIYCNKEQFLFDDYLIKKFGSGKQADEIYIQLEIINERIKRKKFYENSN